MAKLLAKNNHVYYVDRPVTLRDWVKDRNTKEIKRRKPHFFSAGNSFIETDTPNLKVIITPPVPSINMLPEGPLYRLAVKMNEWIVGGRLKKIIKKLGIKDFIFINSFNFYYPTLHQLLKPTLTVYQCLDPLIRAYEVKHGITSEAILAKQVDVIICSSKELFTNKKLLNKNTFFIPNAADIKHSEQALDLRLPVSAILADIKKPIIGYVGAIERRIDYSILTNLLEQNPDKNFVFVGPVNPDYVDVSKFKQPNLFFKGTVPYSEMPAVLKGFDVAIIPFKKDEVSRTIFPLKLFEYLGSGRPVVSTDFNTDLADFTGDTVAYCQNVNEFTTALNIALEDTPELQQKRLDVAAKNTWEHRIVQIENLLADSLKLKQG
ncbi:MAG TPA: glycosyltransferase [Mucilaginibacter sp.]